MVETRLTAMIALSDPERAEELAHALTENEAMLVVMAAGLDQPDGPPDVIITDGEILDPVTPHVALGNGNAGANVGAVLAQASDVGLVAAAARVVAAGYRLSPGVPNNPLDGAKSNAALPVSLSTREMETLALLADGASNKVIARQLAISVHTAKFHVASVLAKLHARNRADAVAIGLKYGFIYL
jgi:DNA-binding CsgD family transcriptional regulator